MHCIAPDDLPNFMELTDHTNHVAIGVYTMIPTEDLPERPRFSSAGWGSLTKGRA